MKAMMIAALAACAVLATGVVAAADEPDEGAAPKAITVDAAAQSRFGVIVTTLKGASVPNTVPSSARVLDPSTLLQLDGELSAAAATFSASLAEAQRTKKLYEEDRTASRRAVEAANAQAQADLQKVNAARRQLALEWGGGVANLRAQRRADLLSDLANVKAELVRVEIPAGVAMPASGLGIAVRGSSESEVYAGIVLGPLPTVDPRLQTRGVLVELKGEAAAKLPIGQMLSAEIPAADATAGTTGVVLPRSALLRRASHVWTYVQTGPATFVRREVHDYRPVVSGWFVTSGFAPGDRVVEAGAAALLGVESPAAAAADTD
jgi:hypothetical protein